MIGHQLPEIILRLRKAPSAHINVGQPDGRIRGVRIEGQRLLVFLLGIGGLLFLFEKLAGRNMRLGLFWLKRLRMLIRGESLLRL